MHPVITPTATDKAAVSHPSSPIAAANRLRDHVKAFVKQLLSQGHETASTDVYAQTLAEVEMPLWETILQYTGQNQRRAAKTLNMSRGTFRKKMAAYGLLKNGKKRLSSSK